MTSLTIRIDNDLRIKLNEIAKEEDRSISAVVRRAILEYIEKRSS